ncbi:hypothetical protein FA15DRAFT_657464 [Coprinopsis marcescibilis]|uniref:Uncharacterized protein n=1 Tax=Coprinopsis marcescibilis TaxID=230819 RepID=A0A5C3KQ78_COPMA|nr:hypothetical protein FA15DRAFT_657464 [Coprinopsis marcescibilis]
MATTSAHVFLALVYTGLVFMVLSLVTSLTLVKTRPFIEWYSSCVASIILALSFGLLIGEFDSLACGGSLAESSMSIPGCDSSRGTDFKSIISVQYHFEPESWFRDRILPPIVRSVIALYTRLAVGRIFYNDRYLYRVLAQHVVRNPSEARPFLVGAYCGVLKFQKISITGIFCVMVLNAVLGTYIAILLYRSRAALREAGAEIQNARTMSVRFGGMSIGILVLTVSFLVFQPLLARFQGSAGVELSVGAMILIIGLLFFTQKDIIYAWLDVFRKVKLRLFKKRRRTPMGRFKRVERYLEPRFSISGGQTSSKSPHLTVQDIQPAIQSCRPGTEYQEAPLRDFRRVVIDGDGSERMVEDKA